MSSASVSRILGALATFPLAEYATSFTKDMIIGVMKTGPVPKHVALIMDGNRTYARNNNLPLKEGHSAGASSLIKVLNVCYRLGVEHVTIYAFSIENFNRSPEEVDTLFGLLRDRLEALSEGESSYAQFNKVAIRIVGNRSMIPADILTRLESVEENTRQTTSKRVLNVCFPYTSRDDIAHAIQGIAQRYAAGEVASRSDIDVKLLHDNMYMGPNSPPLDLLIRTSGHTRLSDFMLWQCNTNCTIEFVSTLWPDFKFLGITTLILKWMYYKTMQLEDDERAAAAAAAIKTGDATGPKINVLQDLPAPPEVVSVTERK